MRFMCRSRRPGHENHYGDNRRYLKEAAPARTPHWATKAWRSTLFLKEPQPFGQMSLGLFFCLRCSRQNLRANKGRFQHDVVARFAS